MDQKERDRFSSFAIRPERAFLLLGIIFGVTILVITPPFQVPDEPQHFFRAFQFSEGRFREVVLIHAENGFAGTDSVRSASLLPKSLGTLVESSDLANVRFHPDNKVTISKIRASLTSPLKSKEREYLPVPSYPPAAYAPQIVGILLGRTLGLSPLLLFYFARIGALAAWLTLTFIAIRNTPVIKWAFFVLALMPMTVFLAASTSSDSVILAMSFLMSATLFRWAYDINKKTIGAWDYAALLGMALAIALAKPIYLSLLFLYFLVPTKKISSRMTYFMVPAVVAAVTVGAYLGWIQLARSATIEGPTVQVARYGADDSPVPNVSPRNQIEFVRSHPIAFAGVLANTFWIGSLYFLSSFVGFLGWLDTPLPPLLVCFYAVALIVACCISVEKIGWKERTLSAAVFGVTMLVSMTYIYIGWNSVGMNRVVGMQGRYLIPLGPALALAFSGNSLRAKQNITSSVLLGFVFFTNSVAAYTLISRYYISAIPIQ